MNNGRKERQPRFHRDTVVGQIPVGMKLVKVEGEPAFISEAKPGDEILRGTPYTKRQFNEIVHLVQYRRIMRETMSLEEFERDILQPKFLGNAKQFSLN